MSSLNLQSSSQTTLAFSKPSKGKALFGGVTKTLSSPKTKGKGRNKKLLPSLPSNPAWHTRLPFERPAKSESVTALHHWTGLCPFWQRMSRAKSAHCPPQVHSALQAPAKMSMRLCAAAATKSSTFSVFHDLATMAGSLSQLAKQNSTNARPPLRLAYDINFSPHTSSGRMFSRIMMGHKSTSRTRCSPLPLAARLRLCSSRCTSKFLALTYPLLASDKGG